MIPSMDLRLHKHAHTRAYAYAPHRGPYTYKHMHAYQTHIQMKMVKGKSGEDLERCMRGPPRCWGGSLLASRAVPVDL